MSHVNMRSLREGRNRQDAVNIQGPYLRPEATETVPLKGSLYVYAQTAASKCCSFITGEDGGIGSLRTISLFFVIITVAVTVALIVQIYQGNFELVPHGSVATDNHKCSIMGTEILKQGGNAIDAAIASTVCLGVCNFHITGLGGGGFLLIYNHRRQQVIDVLDFREATPTSWSHSPKEAGDFVGVPGLLSGLGLAHKLYGKMPWKDLVMPSVQIARLGFQVPRSLVAARNLLQKRAANSKLYDLMMPLEAGQTLALPSLASSLEVIANQGADALYEGNLAADIIATVSAAGGTMTAADLSRYQSVRSSAYQFNVGKYTSFVPGPPSGGSFLTAVLESLQEKENITHSWTSIELAKVMQDVYRHNYSSWSGAGSIGNKFNTDYNYWTFPEAVGSHVAAVDYSELYVSVISGINTWFGSQLLTEGGFVLNNALSNFDSGGKNLEPGMRPFSLAVPVVTVEKENLCGRRLVFGAGDATVALQVLVNFIFHEDNITVAVEAPRFHIAPGGSIIQTEEWHTPKFSEEVLRLFNESGFEVQTHLEPYQSCNVIEKNADTWKSHSDSRGGGIASRF